MDYVKIKQLLIDSGVGKEISDDLVIDMWTRIVRFYQSETAAFEGLEKWVRWEKEKELKK